MSPPSVAAHLLQVRPFLPLRDDVRSWRVAVAEGRP